MSTVTLKNNASMHTMGYKFLRGVPRTDIPYDTAVALSEDRRFDVKITKEEHQRAAFQSGGKPENKQARLNMIAVAIGELEEGNPEHFRTDGTPDARALTQVLGWQVTKDERDAAFKQRNASKPTRISPEAPTPDSKGDLQPGEIKGGTTKLTKMSKADRIAAKEEARELAARNKAAAGTEEDEDDDFPPMDPEDGQGSEGADDEGGSEGEEAVDLNLGEENDDDAADAEEAENTDGEDSGSGDDGNKTTRKGKLVLKGGAPVQPVENTDPTTAGAKDI